MRTPRLNKSGLSISNISKPQSMTTLASLEAPYLQGVVIGTTDHFIVISLSTCKEPLHTCRPKRHKQNGTGTLASYSSMYLG